MPQSRGTEMQHKRKKENKFCLQHKINPQWTIDFKGLILNKKEAWQPGKNGFSKRERQKKPIQNQQRYVLQWLNQFMTTREEKKTKKKTRSQSTLQFSKSNGDKICYSKNTPKPSAAVKSSPWLRLEESY